MVDSGKGEGSAATQAELVPAPFTVLAGASDNLLGSTAHGAQGAITGLSNLAPRVCLKVFEMASDGKYDEARSLASEISRAEWTLIKGNILGTKVSRKHPVDKGQGADLGQYATVWANGYSPQSALCRRPLPEVPGTTKEHVEAECKDLIALERRLEKEGYVGPILRTANKANGHA